ncbi:hypothetical protein L798_11096 [Zootermopsis nevadensis]|uniref:Uncharacterized protein n=1 Tax=Zootermopsis nevadensis TaxID=136037 RepID=A0A067QXW7_ZOONE|nr:hypothetical protein L798_11096 [Zootermopsis nevadensis]
MYEQVFMIAPQLLANTVLGANFLNDFQVVDFKEKCFTTKQDGRGPRHSFFYEDTAGGGDENKPIASLDLAAYEHQMINGTRPGRSERRVAATYDNYDSTGKRVASHSGETSTALFVGVDDCESDISYEGSDIPSLFNLRRINMSPVNGCRGDVKHIANEGDSKTHVLRYRQV